MSLRVASLIPLLALLAACAAPPPPVPPAPAPPPDPVPASTAAAQANDFRKSPPPPGPAIVFVPPRIEEAKLQNGVRVLVVERRELPIVAVEIATDLGADQAPPGVAAFAGAMLVQGTKTRSALAYSDAMGKIGARFGAAVAYDGGGVSGQSLRPHFAEMLELLGDATMHPAFKRAEVERERARRITSLAQMNDRPPALLSIALGEALYPEGHPYRTKEIGTEDALRKIRPADLARYHAAAFRPDHTTVAIAGDISRADAVREVERVLGAWKSAPGAAPPAAAPPAPPAPPAGQAPILIVDRKGLTQSVLTVALPGVPRSTPDYEAILVMNAILGGQFSSRLNLNLREKHAYTYGAHSHFDMRHGPGPFSAGGAIVRESTGPAVQETLAEIRRIREQPVSPEELADAKSHLIQALPARFESALTTASTLAALAMYHLPLDEFATRVAKIQRVTAADVQRVARATLIPDRLRVVMVADAAAVQAQLSALGLGAADIQKPAAEPPARKPAHKR